MKKLILTLAVLAGAMTGAHAQAYLTGSVGAAHGNADCTGTTNCDNSSTGFKLIGGYQFHPNFAAEVSYLDFGKITADVFDPSFGNINGKIKTKGFGVGVAASTAFTKEFYGVARLGLASLETKVDVSTAGLSGSDSETKTKPYFGVGAGYRFNEQFSLEAAADFSRAEYAGEKSSVRLLSVGATFRF